MESVEPEVCLVCFSVVEKEIFVPTKESGKIFKHCLKYLHTAITSDYLIEKQTQFENVNQLPFCKKCFDSVLELAQLTEQIKKFQKEISDLTTSFTLSVLHRRSNSAFFSSKGPANTKSKKTHFETPKLTIEVDVTGLPPQLFSIHPQESISQNITDPPYFNTTNLNEIENADLFINLDCGTEQSTTMHCENTNDPASERLFPHPSSSRTSSPRGSPIKIKQENSGTLRNSIKLPNIKLERLAPVDTGAKIVILPQEKVLSRHLFKYKGMKVKPRTHNIGMTQNIVRENNLDPLSTVRSVNTSLNLKNKSPNKVFHHDTTKGKFGFSCKVCKKVFTSSSGLRRHELIHSSKGQFQCPICKKRFNQMSTLKAHEVVHTEGRPFTCTICDKAFRFNSNRIRHETLHATREQVFKCDTCNKPFLTNFDLEMHLINVHGAPKSKKGSFTIRKSSKKLKISQTSVKKSPPSKKSLSIMSDAKSHESRNTEEMGNMFKCTVCGKTFEKNCNLLAHERVHTQERPFNCLYCDQTFRFSSNRSRHHRTCHSHKKKYVLL